MTGNGPPRMAAPAAPFFSGRSRESRQRWYSFLEDECLKDNGLLCFYDRHKSREVAYFCGLLADCLASAAAEGDDEDAGPFFELGALPVKGGSTFAPPKAINKE